MFWQDPDEAQVTFHDASANFPEEEWQLLHKWQKDLYRNLMNEIHQALISLGPIIATTVSSLKSKEKDGLIPMDTQHLKKEQSFHHSPILREENQYMMMADDSERRETRDCLNKGISTFNTDVCLIKEEPISIVIDHPFEEIQNRTTTSSVHEAVSFYIVGEDETYCMDQKDSKIMENISSPAGDGFIRRKWKVEDIMKGDEKIRILKDVSGNAKTNVNQRFKKGINSKNRMWTQPYELRGKKKMPSTEGAMNMVHSNTQDRCCKTEDPDLKNECDSHFGKATLVTCSPYMLRQFRVNNSGSHLNPKKEDFDNQKSADNERIFECKVCYKGYMRKHHLIRHQRIIHKGVRPEFFDNQKFADTKRLFQCKVCYKCYIRKDNLIRHQRIHPGEQPEVFDNLKSADRERTYQCKVCYKCFIRKDHLSRHKRVHPEEQPEVFDNQKLADRERTYQCKICYKCFIRKDHLSRHQRTHTGERPHPCTECKKSFMTLHNLVRHKRIHFTQKPYPCTECGKSFNRKDQLLGHQRKHKRVQHAKNINRSK